MSEVFSFRLDKDNPREAQALSVLYEWKDKGHSLRFVLVEALLALNQETSDTSNVKSKIAIGEILSHLSELNRKLDMRTSTDLCEKTENSELTPIFLTSIKQTIKPGMKTD